MKWVESDGIMKSVVTEDNLPNLAAWLNERPIFIDRRFAVTESPDHAKSQFCQEVVNHRPALKILYDGVLNQNRAGSASAWRSSDLMDSLHQNDPGDVSVILEIKQQARNFIDATSAAEDLAGALLLILDELVESLIVELTGKGSRFYGLGPMINGVALADALKASGNFVRHKSEWALYMSRRQLLESTHEKSLRHLARLISRDRSADEATLMRHFFDHTDHMRESLFGIAEIYHTPEQPYSHLEAAIMNLGSLIVDRFWVNRTRWEAAVR